MLKKTTPICLWFTGLSGAGKTTLGNHLKSKMNEQGFPFVLIDGDDMRNGINHDLGFTLEARRENIRRAAEMTRIILKSGINVICCFISPTRQIRSLARSIVKEKHFIEVFVNASVEICRQRDPKGIYDRALRGQILHVSGIDSPYEPPNLPDIHIDTMNYSVEQCLRDISDSILPLLADPPSL